MNPRAGTMTSALAPALAMLALTASFCWVAWLGTGAYLAWFGTLAGVRPTWAMTVAMQPSLPFPFHAIVVQSLAVASLAANLAWAMMRMRRANGGDPALLPFVCHVAVVLACLFLAGAGMLSPLVEVAAVLR